MDAITVTATKSQKSVDGVTASVQIITSTEIEQIGAADLKDIFEKTPGLTLQYGTFPAASSVSKSSVSIRGMGASGTLFLVDGRRLAGEVKNPYDLDRIPSSIIDRIEIIKGAMSVLYGADAVGGVINIITKKSKKNLEGTAGVQSGINKDGDGSKTSGNVSLRGKKNKFSYSMYVNAANTDPYYEQEKTRTTIKTSSGNIPPSSHPNPDINNIRDIYDVDVTYLEDSSVYTMGGRFEYEPVKETVIGVEFNYFDEERDGEYRSSFFPTGISPTPGKRFVAFDTPVHSHDENWRRDVSVDISSNISSDLRLNFRTYNSYYEKRNSTTAVNWEDAGFSSREASASMAMDADVDFWSYEGYAVYAPGESHILTGGAEYRDENRKATIFNQEGTFESRDVDYKALYIQDEWQITDTVNVTLGGRYDDISNSDNKFTFKVGMVKRISDMFNVRCNFAQGYRTPDILENYMRKNTPAGALRGALTSDPILGKEPFNLKPEFTNSYEIGFRGRKNGFHYSADLFYNDISDKIEKICKNPGEPSSYFTYENINDAETMGMELAAGYDSASGISVDFNWVELNTEDKATGLDLEFNPKRQIAATLAYAFNSFNIWTMGKYVGEQYTPAADDDWIDEFFIVDVGANYKMGVKKNYELYGGVNNIFDEKIDKLAGSNAGPYFFAGMRVNF
jgi:outer membrane receptor for ferrienterochelin and colicins